MNTSQALVKACPSTRPNSVANAGSIKWQSGAAMLSQEKTQRSGEGYG